jgi:glycosyltransferase involved in cell wall biosynthesis
MTTKIALLVPVCSRNHKYESINESQFIKYLFKSFQATREQKYEYTVYVGVDSTDEFYMNHLNALADLGTTPIVLKDCEHKPANAWNKLLERAVKDNNEYFFQIGDDVEIKTNNWTSTFVEYLKAKNNFGIVGPIDRKALKARSESGKKPVLEQAFFHRTHYDIFGYLFYPQIHNHYCDDWLTETYSDRNAATILDNIECENMTRDERYTSKKVHLLESYILESSLRISNYLGDTTNKLKIIQDKNSYTIYIDTTLISKCTIMTGIQRVVTNIFKNIYKVHPMCKAISLTDQGPVTNNRFTESFCKLKRECLGEDTKVTFKSGDILFMLDNSIYYLENYSCALSSLKTGGLTIVPLVHDVIPITHPQYVTESHSNSFRKWFSSLENTCSGVICVSDTTKSEIYKLNSKLNVRSFSPGNKLVPSGHMRIMVIPPGKNVLMVGTIEPRKRYSDVLAQFEKIWETNTEINLIIVGKLGWMSDDLANRIETHPRIWKNLFWLCDTNDSDLIYLYRTCDLFLFASDAEGFGIPTIEAASHSVPLLLRDTPIFREVAGDNAIYFKDTEELPRIILDQTLSYPESRNVKMNSWEDSSLDVLRHLLKFRMEHLKNLKMLE